MLRSNYVNIATILVYSHALFAELLYTAGFHSK